VTIVTTTEKKLSGPDAATIHVDAPKRIARHALAMGSGSRRVQ
jgi:hypothetical protein